MFGRKRKTDNKIKIPQEKQRGVRLTVDENVSIEVKTGNCSHQGAREYQEDSFGYSNIIDSGIISEKGFAAVLADGMGGLENGRDISRFTVSAFLEKFGVLDYDAPFPPQLEDIADKINEEAREHFAASGGSGAGSTIAAAFVYKTKLYWLCIGDSRLYLLRNGQLYAVNEDHDYFNQLLSDYMAGETDMEQINANEQKDRLTSYIGSEGLSHIDANKKGFSICLGDTLILCSDGIYNGVSDAEMISILNQNEPQRASEKITRTVLDKNIAGQDNLTVMVINFGG